MRYCTRCRLMARPKAVVTAKIEANMGLIARAQEREAAMALIQRATGELFHRLGLMRAEEMNFIEAVRAENCALESGASLRVAA
jgi:methylphosphotriester-DNA--protein-cysteine methyltransferase